MLPTGLATEGGSEGGKSSAYSMHPRRKVIGKGPLGRKKGRKIIGGGEKGALAIHIKLRGS